MGNLSWRLQGVLHGCNLFQALTYAAYSFVKPAHPAPSVSVTSVTDIAAAFAFAVHVHAIHPPGFMLRDMWTALGDER